MNVQKHETFDIYYDEAADFLEITFGLPPEMGLTDDVEQGVFVTKNEKTNELYGIGILNFKKRVEVLKKLLDRFNVNFPFEIKISK